MQWHGYEPMREAALLKIILPESTAHQCGKATAGGKIAMIFEAPDHLRNRVGIGKYAMTTVESGRRLPAIGAAPAMILIQGK